MSQPGQLDPIGAPGSAYGALLLGIAAVATFTLPPLPIVLGILGLAVALRARAVLRRHSEAPGTGPSLIGAILSVFGILTAVPWVIAFLIAATNA